MLWRAFLQLDGEGFEVGEDEERGPFSSERGAGGGAMSFLLVEISSPAAGLVGADNQVADG